MDFLPYLKETAEEIDRELETFSRRWLGEVEGVSSKLLDFNRDFMKASEGGKKLRGVLVRLGYEMAGGEPTSEIIKPALAIEINHTAVLAHDDIIDLSPTRRGKPSIYRALGGDHYAISQTICLGDIGFFLALRLISNSDFSEERRGEAGRVFIEMMLSTGLGEMLDVELPHLGGERKEEDVLSIHRLKTAYYTIIYPLSIGAVLAGGDRKLLDQIRKVGEALGIAFQIQDDILGVFGDEKTLGKSVTSDIEEGKNTLLIIHALEKATPGQKEILDRYYGKGKVGEGELEDLRQVFKETGALEYSQQKAAQLVSEAKQIIEQMEIMEDKKQMLRQMADFLVERQK